MCVFCAAIPVSAAVGVAVDNQQRQRCVAADRPLPRVRPYLILAAIVILLLLSASAFWHIRFSARS